MPANGVAVAERSIFVLGGARSGKSAFAEHLALETGHRVVYVATATAEDQEMAERIAHHRARRPPAWRTVEARTDVAARVRAYLRLPQDATGPTDIPQPEPGARVQAVTLLVEDLTLLLSNLMGALPEEFEARATREVDALLAVPVDTLILVSNEVGLGLVPPYPIGRAFRDALGRLNQHVAAKCHGAYLLVAGLPLRLK